MPSQIRPSVPETGAREPQQQADHAAQRRSRSVRLWVLGVSLAIITALGVGHQFGIQVAGGDALCPFAGIETLWSLITSATLIQKVAASSVILFGIALVTAFVFRRAFCGYICPLGSIQEFAGKLGLKIFGGRRPEVPRALDRPARYLKYAVLAVFTIWSWQAASLVLRPYDPWVAYMHLTSKEVLSSFGVGLAILGLTVVGSVVCDRFFCKYLCPMGAFLGLISRVSVFKVRRNAVTCIDCKACDRACPVNVSVSQAEVVNDAECINCNECVNVCPVKDALVVSGSVAVERRTLRPTTVLGMVIATIAVGVAAATAVGTFSWTLPALEKVSAQTGGTVDVENIRGSMTFRDIARVSGIPESAFQEKFGVKTGEMDSKMKDLAGTYGFNVETDVREFVAERVAQTPSP